MFKRTTRIFDRLLLAAMPNTYVSRLQPPLRQRYQELVSFDQTPMGEYPLHDGSVATLYVGYRDFVKRSWRLMFPPLQYLYSLSMVNRVDADAKQVLDSILQAQTLTVSLDKIQALADAHAKKNRDITGIAVTADGQEKWQFATPNSLSPIVESYRQASRILEARLKRASGHTLKGLSTLEMGTGQGLHPFANVERGAAKAVGLDLSYAPKSWLQRAEAINTFAEKTPDIRNRVSLQNMNANHTDFADHTFDLVHSTSVLEHVQDIQQNFQEMFRLLKPGGWAIHSVGPYFGPIGGHALVTLDFPWGHARLADDAIEAYLHRQRPHEAKDAIDFLQHGLTQPHHVLHDYMQFALEAGFELVFWEENILDSHRALLSSTVVQQVRHHYPAVTVNDLLTNELVITLYRP